MPRGLEVPPDVHVAVAALGLWLQARSAAGAVEAACGDLVHAYLYPL